MNSDTPKLPKHHRFKDLTGQVFNRLTVIGYGGSERKHTIWMCKCKCEKLVKVRREGLIAQKTRSCGCLKNEIVQAGAHVTNGESRGRKRSVEYKAYHGAKERCQNPNGPAFADYGGRGIEFRFTSFEDFLAEVGRKPSPKYSINRINNDGHYEPGNVRWADGYEQARNRRSTHTLTSNGISKSLAEWAEATGLLLATIDKRLRTGFCSGCAVSLPRGGKCVHRELKD